MQCFSIEGVTCGCPVDPIGCRSCCQLRQRCRPFVSYVLLFYARHDRIQYNREISTICYSRGRASSGTLTAKRPQSIITVAYSMGVGGGGSKLKKIAASMGRQKAKKVPASGGLRHPGPQPRARLLDTGTLFPLCQRQGRRSLWDRGDTSPPIFGPGGT